MLRRHCLHLHQKCASFSSFFSVSITLCVFICLGLACSVSTFLCFPLCCSGPAPRVTTPCCSSNLWPSSCESHPAELHQTVSTALKLKTLWNFSDLKLHKTSTALIFFFCKRTPEKSRWLTRKKYFFCYIKVALCERIYYIL